MDTETKAVRDGAGFRFQQPQLEDVRGAILDLGRAAVRARGIAQHEAASAAQGRCLAVIEAAVTAALATAPARTAADLDPRVHQQVWAAARDLDATQRAQPDWLWHEGGKAVSCYGRWPKGAPGMAPYVRADIALGMAALAAPSAAGGGEIRGTDAWYYDIEAAPRDRTPVLLTVPSLHAGQLAIVGEAYFNPEACGGSWWWAGTADGEYADSPLEDTNSAPIAWRHLPAPATSPSQGSDTGEAGRDLTGPVHEHAVGRQAETPDSFFRRWERVIKTMPSGARSEAPESPTAPQGADLSGLSEALKAVADLADEIGACAAQSGVPVEGWAMSLGWENVKAIRDGVRSGALVPTASAQPAPAGVVSLFRAALVPFAHHYDLNDCRLRHPDDALEVPIRDLAAAKRALALAHRGSVAPTSGERDGWSHDMAAAPAGEEVEIGAGRMTFLAKLVPNGTLTTEGKPCDQWQATREGEHPPCWSDGCCWASNEDETASLQPDRWRRVASPPAATQDPDHAGGEAR